MNTMTMNTNSMIYIPSDDFRRLKILASATSKKTNSQVASTLRGELARAAVLAREHLPAGVVTVNSRVRFRDIHSGVEEEYVLTWPDRADGGVERISVLAPIGTALLGYREGNEVSWPTPGGTRRLLVLEVEPVSDDSLADPNEGALERLLNGSR